LSHAKGDRCAIYRLFARHIDEVQRRIMRSCPLRITHVLYVTSPSTPTRSHDTRRNERNRTRSFVPQEFGPPHAARTSRRCRDMRGNILRRVTKRYLPNDSALFNRRVELARKKGVDGITVQHVSAYTVARAMCQVNGVGSISDPCDSETLNRYENSSISQSLGRGRPSCN